jgi:arylsulfatase
MRWSDRRLVTAFGRRLTDCFAHWSRRPIVVRPESVASTRANAITRLGWAAGPPGDKMRTGKDHARLVFEKDEVMVRPFRGTINLDVRDSKEDWEAFLADRAPGGAPNVLVVLYDDTGQAAWSPYGGRINMPTMDRLAANGLTYSQWHTTALCSPTRSTFLTGRNHHQNGFASISETAFGFPGFSSHIRPEHAPMAHILRDAGWSTFWVGKNHNVPVDEWTMGSSTKNWPLGMGYDRFYGFIGGETNQWYPDLAEDNHYIDQPYLPEDGYHLSKDLADKALSFIRDAKQSEPDKPWYM